MTTMLMLLLTTLALPGRAQVAAPPPSDTEGLFLDMSKVNLGTITSEEDKQRYIYTIQLEKARITRKTLKGVYENAFELYQKGEFEAAKELTSRILAIDPTFEDAAILRRASEELRGAKKVHYSERKLVDGKFEEGMALYRQGRLVEAAGRWEEAVKLSPTNLKAMYWLRKARKEMADEHFRRGERAYRQHRLREALDQWYSALVLNPRYPRLSGMIAKAEAEAREADSNEKLQTALNLYSQGQTVESLRILDTVLETGPGNSKALKLMAEIRSEIAGQHVAQGRQYYEGKKYNEAIAEWKKAVTFGYDSRAADQLVARAKEGMRREETATRKRVELAKRREEEQKKAQEEEALKAAEEEKKKAALAVKPGAEGGATAATASGAGAGATAGSGAGAGATAGSGAGAGATAGAATGSGAATVSGAATPAAPAATSVDAQRSSQQHYLSGVIYFQKGDYVKSRDEWTLALQLDPSNSDAKAGLERIEKLYGGR